MNSRDHLNEIHELFNEARRAINNESYNKLFCIMSNRSKYMQQMTVEAGLYGIELDLRLMVEETVILQELIVSKISAVEGYLSSELATAEMRKAYARSVFQNK